MSESTYYDVSINYGTHLCKRVVLAKGPLAAMEKGVNETTAETDQPKSVEVKENEDIYGNGWY
jgi:hypothetical protein